MSCFYFSYFGNKRTEFKYIEDLIDLEKYKTIAEPFCGSSSCSHLLYKKGFKGDIKLNDNDPNLINFYKKVKKKGSESFQKFVNKKLKNLTKEQHKEIVEAKDKNLNNWFYYNKCYNFRKGVYPIRKVGKEYDFKKYETYENMIKSDKTTFYNEDFLKFLKDNDNEETLFIFDPPYLDSFNAYYYSYTALKSEHMDEEKNLIDNTKIFIDIKNFIDNMKGSFIMFINKNAIMDYVYKDYFKKEYSKTYQYNKKKVIHGIYSNIN